MSVIFKCEVSEEIKTFLNEANTRCNDRLGENHPFYYDIEICSGKKYLRIDTLYIHKDTGSVNSKSAYCAIDKDGNVFKMATYQVVAKGIRGNVNNSDNGFSALMPDGFIVRMK